MSSNDKPSLAGLPLGQSGVAFETNRPARENTRVRVGSWLVSTSQGSAVLVIDRSSWRTRAEARLALFDYIEAFYNPTRRHSALGYLSPAEFERRYSSERINAA